MVVGFFSLLGSLTGILVETSIAAQLGLSKSSDTFYVAFTVPYIITNLISATGQFSLVPFFSSLDARHSAEELWRGFSYAVNVIFLGLSAIAVVGAAISPWLIYGIAPGFTPAQLELAGRLARWLFLIIIPAGVAETFRSFLFSQHRFALSSAAGFFRNALVIICILFTFRSYGMWSIVLGYFAGYFFQLAILGAQLLLAFPVRYSMTLKSGGEAFRNLRGAGSAQIAAALAWQGVVLVERIIASFLPPGTLTALNYGLKIMSSIAEVLAGSVGTAALPPLSRAAAQGNFAEERRTFRDTLEISLVLLSPFTVFCLMLSHPIIRLVFERGQFTPEATALMSTVFFYYSLSLIGFALIRVLIFRMFARHESGTYVRLAFFLYASTIAGDLVYVGLLRLGAAGIPLGLLTSSTITLALAFHRNTGDLKGAFDRVLGRFALKNLLAALLAAALVGGMKAWLAAPVTTLQTFTYLCFVCGAGSLVFMAALAATRAIPLSILKVLRTSDTA
jgi:putative peptidoglycan lipid II flippase